MTPPDPPITVTITASYWLDLLAAMPSDQFAAYRAIQQALNAAGCGIERYDQEKV